MSTGDEALRLESASPELLAALEAAGWDRDRDVAIDHVVEELAAQGYEINTYAAAFLRSLCGLRIDPANEDGPNFQNTEQLIVDPLGVGRRHRPEAVEVESLIGESVFPVAWWLSYSYVHVAASGRMVAFSSGLTWSLGNTPEQGLDMAVRASEPLVCIGSRSGQARWPKPPAWT
ncbi:SUKH-3 domain-containing protein [Actinoplanes sp. NPDC049548]|uniref:SUKH-3 domain-containing protein n=1 Tax=Actinoplanes sp. NPDC049548 TaxID=3155152 RepID=UPI00344AE657